MQDSQVVEGQTNLQICPTKGVQIEERVLLSCRVYAHIRERYLDGSQKLENLLDQPAKKLLERDNKVLNLSHKLAQQEIDT